MQESSRLSLIQIMVLTISATLALGVFSFPRDAFEAGQRSALYGVFGSWLAAVGGAMLITLAVEKFPGTTVVPVLRKVVGWLVYPIIISAIGFALIYAGFLLRNFVDLLREVFYVDTPDAVLAVGLLLVGAYLAGKGMPNMARAIAFSVPLALLVLVLGYLAVLPRVNGHFLAIQPLDATDTLAATYRSFQTWIGYPALIMFGGLAEDRRSLRLGVTYGFVLAILVMGLIFLDAVGLFGMVGIRRVVWPTISVLRLLRIQGFLVERLGLFVLVGWTVLVISSISVHLWAIAHAAMELANSKRVFVWALMAGILLIFIATRLPANVAQLFELTTYLGAVEMAQGYGLALVVLVVARVRGIKGWES